ncbi:hypothetical protein FB567DRAFT_526526 [Paraphoma chrysanthemicola]|uniref:Uncharacterized protein n=1 Tax=Paraphoma chrysanthemicola TaxID=798071 RepID=A0A8K0R3L8_9PLEO|nr:hypothetical protein FB567DRAFT_526526 [Paraphoma chrysanthemicola]
MGAKTLDATTLRGSRFVRLGLSWAMIVFLSPDRVYLCRLQLESFHNGHRGKSTVQRLTVKNREQLPKRKHPQCAVCDLLFKVWYEWPINQYEPRSIRSCDEGCVALLRVYWTVIAKLRRQSAF